MRRSDTNITHDLKTPLSPIRGYAELLLENGVPEEGSCRQYAAVMLKNTAYMETLIDDLKLTYQLDNRMLPIHRSRQDIVRFLKELAIDILNTPEYENRTIHFLSDDAPILFPFDPTLLTRAFRNLIINAFVHGNETPKSQYWPPLRIPYPIAVADNGRNPPEDAAHPLDRITAARIPAGNRRVPALAWPS
ncbi:MAG: sensor histidine kinase [Eisenbergiella massiliensis]